MYIYRATKHDLDKPSTNHLAPSTFCGLSSKVSPFTEIKSSASSSRTGSVAAVMRGLTCSLLTSLALQVDLNLH